MKVRVAVREKILVTRLIPTPKSILEANSFGTLSNPQIRLY